MKNWFTVHDPHPTPNWLKWYIYLQDKYKEIAAEISVGDRVFFYEAKTTKQVQFKGCIGKMGLVHIGHVTGSAYPRKIEDALSIYNDGGRKLWGIGIPTDAENSNGFVPQAKVVDVLGYASNYYFKGFAGGKGIKQIEADEANDLQALFELSSHSPDDFARTSTGTTKGSHRYPVRVRSAQAPDKHNRRIDEIQPPISETDDKTRGYVYILEVNDIDLPVSKIGRTTRDPHERCREINNSSTGDFIWSVAHQIAVDNCKELESLVHLKLAPLRQKKREFFNINADDAYTALISIFDSQTKIKRINIEEISAVREAASPNKEKTQRRQNFKHNDPKYAEVLQLFESLLNIRGVIFDQPNKPVFGMSDGNVGVQWNIAINRNTGEIRLGVNLEGTAKTGGWLIAPFILSKPNIEKLKAELKHPQDIFVRFTRDAWQGASRLNIMEEFLGGKEFALSEIDQHLWEGILIEAISCLDESRNYRGRKEGQTVTLKSDGSEVIKGISPHINVHTYLNLQGDLTDNIRNKIAELQPVYDWIKRASQS